MHKIGPKFDKNAKNNKKTVSGAGHAFNLSKISYLEVLYLGSSNVPKMGFFTKNEHRKKQI
jgi:hypothetical protein